MATVPENEFPYSTKESIADDVAALRRAFKSRATRPLDVRRKQLEQLQKLIHEGWPELRDALHKDLHRHSLESRMSDVNMVDSELQDHLDYLDDWAKPEKVWTSLTTLPGSSFIQPEPLGVVCIISTWNYPVQLALQPLVGALSAGNCVLLRLPGDDTSVHTNNALIRLFAKYVDKRFVRLVHGGVDATKTMLEHRFDLIFCTGGTFIGKIVAEAAAKFLTPTVLELGGKSPAIVDETCDVAMAVKRIGWASFMNAGQTCVRPDYLMVSAKIGDEFVKQLEQTLKKFFGENAKESDNLARLINARAYERVSSLLKQDKQYVTFGGDLDESQRYIAPTILNFKREFASFSSSACMSQEIFGPILPIYYYEDLNEAIDYITEHEKPLALYVYTSNKITRERVINETSSGGVCVNDSNIQLSNPNLPFGGVGNSGMGAYHGKFSFDTFSHKKAVLVRTSWLDIPQRYYPYTENTEKLMAKLIKPIPRSLVFTAKFAVLQLLIVIAAAIVFWVVENKEGSE